MDDRGQLYTMEGVAAALIMLLTVYLVLNATSVYTAGDTHITDMQLEALGSDALVMMDTAPNGTANSSLQDTIEGTITAETFKEKLLNYLNAAGTGPTHNIQYNATYTCRNTTAAAYPPTISYSIASTRNLTGGEHTVRATRWVIVNEDVCNDGNKPRAVLVEVLLWRD